MSLATEFTAYGIDPDDRIYDRTFDTGYRGGPLCRVCNGHSPDSPRARCDLELARAAEMDDPCFCPSCRKAFDRLTEPSAAPGARRYRCRVCRERDERWLAARKMRRAGVSAKAMRRARWLEPELDLRGLPAEQIRRIALEEVES